MDQGLEPDGASPPANPWKEAPAPKREPMLRMPWQVGVIALTIVLIFAVEWTRGAVDDDAIQYGFIPAAMMQGGLSGLVTALFIHGSWTHVLINAAFAVAFGAPLARRLGSGAIGGGLFFLFFLVCGVLGNAGYALAHPNSGAPVVGASGAIAGLYAAMSRLLGGPRPLPLTARPVVALGAFWIVGNLMIGLLKFDAGFGAAGGSTAWEAHIAGYLAGLLLMPLFVAAAPLRVGDRQGG